MRTQKQTQPTEILLEHPDEAEVMDALLNLADQLEGDASTHGASLDDLLASLEERDAGLMGHQESLVFPGLETRFGAGSPVLTVLESDHEEIRRLTQAVRSRAGEGDGADPGALATDVRSLARLRAEHVLREGAILRTLRHHVTSADDRWEPSRTWTDVNGRRALR